MSFRRGEKHVFFENLQMYKAKTLFLGLALLPRPLRRRWRRLDAASENPPWTLLSILNVRLRLGGWPLTLWWGSPPPPESMRRIFYFIVYFWSWGMK